MDDFNPTILKSLYTPPPDSHKGQNGKLLVIGGSKLFHASIFWSANVASKIVDLVHFVSPANENNDLVRFQLKQGFWNGIVVEWADLEYYIEEDDAILIGPGMPREEGLFEGDMPTSDIINSLIDKYPQKKWVVDGGALQEVRPDLLNSNHIITPHTRELVRLLEKLPDGFNSAEYEFLFSEQSKEKIEQQAKMLQKLSQMLNGVTILSKGRVDVVCQNHKCTQINGGNSGMTKGGTGDVLAGLVAALYTKNEAYLAALAASYVTKKAGDRLFEHVGPYFNAGDLVEEVPKALNSATYIHL